MRRRAPLALLLCTACAAAGCGRGAEGVGIAPPTASLESPPAAGPDTSTVTPTAKESAEEVSPVSPGPPVPLGRPGGWRVTTYYTARESLYQGERKPVRGCTRFHCSHGKD